MSKPYLAAAALAVAVAATPLTHGQEVSTCPVIYRDAAPLNLASTIGLDLDESISEQVVERAISLWEARSGYGDEFQRFLIRGEGDRNFRVRFERRRSGNGHCATLFRKEIVLYRGARDNRGRVRARFAPPGPLGPWSRGQRLSLEVVGRRPAIRAELGGILRPARLVLDSGSDGLVLFGDVARRTVTAFGPRLHHGRIEAATTRREIAMAPVAGIRSGGVRFDGLGWAGLLPDIERPEDGLLPLAALGPVLLDPANGVLVARARLRAPGATGATPPPQVDRPAVTARLLSGEQRRRGGRRVALRFADVERALVMLRRAIRPGGSCDAYFRALGVDPEVLLSPGEPPYLIYLDGNRFAGDGICAKAQAGEPFSYVFLNPDCRLDGKDTCAVASLLLHEMGHLARRDVTDNEPPEFFEACRMGCVRPGDFY